jgi:hypothetical protein
MKPTKMLLLMLALFTLFSCEDPMDIQDTQEVEVNTDPRTYKTTIGTYLKIKNADYDYSDSRGSLLLKDSSGNSRLAADNAGAVHGEVTYELKSLNGEVYSRRELVSTAFRTNINGDFAATINYTTLEGEAIQKIKNVNLVLTVIADNIAYEKKLNFSTETMWDFLTDFGSMLFEFDIVKHHTKTYSYDNELSQSYDINADIELVEAVNQTASKRSVQIAKSRM